jgi:hypothetical protein
MTFHFEDNEFTAWELLEYFKRAYVCQISGAPFCNGNLVNWVRLKKIPEAYGGYSILKTTRYKQLGNLQVFTIEGLSRQEMEAIVGSLLDFEETANKKRKLDVIAKPTRPRKQRTKLYYQILERAGKQYTKKTLLEATLPKYWKEASIKPNQLVNRSAANIG